MTFFESKTCKSGEHCNACRNKEAGRKFRTDHPFELPPEGADFECPPERGAKPWGFTSPRPEPIVPLPSREKPRPIAPQPGSVVSVVLNKLGYKKISSCGCAAFESKMNGWGWRGCFRHRTEIVEWFTAKAKEQGIEIDGAGVWALVRGGLKDLIAKSH